MSNCFKKKTWRIQKSSFITANNNMNVTQGIFNAHTGHDGYKPQYYLSSLSIFFFKEKWITYVMKWQYADYCKDLTPNFLLDQIIEETKSCFFIPTAVQLSLKAHSHGTLLQSKWKKWFTSKPSCSHVGTGRSFLQTLFDMSMFLCLHLNFFFSISCDDESNNRKFFYETQSRVKFKIRNHNCWDRIIISD